MLRHLKNLASSPFRHPWLALLLAFLICATAFGLVNAWAWQQYRVAEQALREDKLEEARTHITGCLQIWRRSPSAHLLLARIERVSGHSREAEEQLGECVRLQGGASEATQLEEILLRAQDGELAEVEPMLWRCVDEGHPESTQILETLARIYLHESRMAVALIALNRWLERDPGAVRAWHWRGWLYERMDELPLAIADYRKALELDPARDGARLRLARLLVEQNAAAEALPHLLELQRRRPEDADVLVLLACCYQLQGEEDRAVGLLDCVLASHPDNAEALSWRGQLASLQGYPAEAENWLRRALARRPADLRTLYALSQCLKQQGEEKEAARILARHKAVEADVLRRRKLLHSLGEPARGAPDVFTEVGVISLRLGEETTAVEWLHRALQADANYKPAHEALLRYYESKGDTQKADEHRRRLQLLWGNPTSPPRRAN